MEYTPKARFWLVVLPSFLAIVAFSAAFYWAISAGSGRLLHELGGSFGSIAAWGLGVAIALALVNLATRRFLKVKKLLGRRSEVLKPEHHRFLVLQKKWVVDVHLAAGIIGFLGALLHGYLLWRFRNVWLLGAMLLFAWMAVVGLVLRFGGLGAGTKRYVYLVHSQWVTVILLVVATVVGHAGF